MIVGDVARSVLNVKFPFLDESGRITGIAGISTDITSQRLAEALREELRERGSHRDRTPA